MNISGFSVPGRTKHTEVGTTKDLTAGGIFQTGMTRFIFK